MATEADETSTVCRQSASCSVSASPWLTDSSCPRSSTRASTRSVWQGQQSRLDCLLTSSSRDMRAGVQDLEEELAVPVRPRHHPRPRLALAYLPVVARQGDVSITSPCCARVSQLTREDNVKQPGRQGLHRAPPAAGNSHLGRGQQLPPDRDRSPAETAIRPRH